MPLFLIETALPKSDTRPLLEKNLLAAAAEVGGSLVESRSSLSGDRLFAIFEHPDLERLAGAVRLVDTEAEVSEVRLVGATVDEARSSSSGNFLAEWDLPDDLSMDAYLARKADKASLYEQIPEVEFRRTYVREDMEKCLCFYDADCAEDVQLARKKVDTPVDRLTELA